MTSGLGVLVHYGRTDLASLLPAQTDRIASEYATYMMYTHRNYYFGLSRWLTPLMLDAGGVEVVTAPGAPAVSSAAPAVSTAAPTALPAASTAPSTATTVPSAGVHLNSAPSQPANRCCPSVVGVRPNHRHKTHRHRAHHRRWPKRHASRRPKAP
jgi:hypothetical protein